MKFIITAVVGLCLFASSNVFALGEYIDVYDWQFPENYFPLENSDPMQKWVLKQEFELREKRWELTEYNALPANHGDAHVCLYEDDYEAAYSMTCDVSLTRDEDWWLKINNEIGVPVTHFVVTDRINFSISSGWSTWAGVRRLYEGGITMGGHSSTHSSVELHESGAINFVYDYKVCKEVMEDSLDNFICYTMAHPGGGYGNDSDSIAMFYNGRRGTQGKPNRPYQVMYNNASASGGWNQEHFDALLDTTNQYWRGYYVNLSHGVGADGDSTRIKWEARMAQVKALEDRIWLTTFPNMMRYGQERDAHTLTVNSVTADMIKFTITDSMHDTIFTYPLTVKVRVDEGWSTAFATQAGKVMETAFKTQDGAKFVLVKAVPDQGEVTLSTVLGNIAPAITSTAVTAGYVDSLYTYDVNADDADSAEVLTYSLTSSPAGMVIDSVTGVITWTPGAAATEAVTVLVTDKEGATDTQSWNLEITAKSAIGRPFAAGHAADAAVTVMTNPVRDGIVRISINENVREAITVSILDAHGNRVATLFDDVPVLGLQQIRWDAGGLSGVYVISVKGNSVNYTYRVLVTE